MQWGCATATTWPPSSRTASRPRTLHWACQIAGVVITPVNWRAKPEDLDYVLDDACARAVCFDPVSADAVANASHARAIPRIAVGGAGGGTVGFDDLCGRAPADAVPRAGPDDISVMLYTSGTTGRPKGVPRTHAAERTAAVAHVAQNRYGYGERTLGVMPVEIESVLSLHPGVAEVAVAGLPDERLGQRITAFVTRRAASDVDADSLDAYCKASALTDFKRPRAYVFVRSIPKSPVGKILRRMLLAGEYEGE